MDQVYTLEWIVHLLREYLYYVFLGWIILYFLIRRKYKASRNRYMAVFFQSLLIFIVFTAALTIEVEQLNPQWIFAALGLVVILGLIFRNFLFPYQFRCKNCGNSIKLINAFVNDENLCDDCKEPETEEKEEMEQNPDSTAEESEEQ